MVLMSTMEDFDGDEGRLLVPIRRGSWSICVATYAVALVSGVAATVLEGGRLV